MYSYQPRNLGPPPNYALRRLIAISGVLVVVLVLWTVVAKFNGGGGDDSATTTTSSTAPAADPIVAPPPCAAPEESEPTIFAREQDWFRTLVDPTYAVPELYEPPDLVSAAEANYASEFRIRALMAADLNGMRNALLAAGLPEVGLLAAYRSVADQQALFDRRVAELGLEQAAIGTARPGHSEHHLGTAIDVRLLGESDVDATFGATPTGQWMEENSWRYGFILSYPEGKQDVTCYKYEPWHFRYVGPELAQRVFASGLTLREYLWHWEVTGKEPGAPSATPSEPTTGSSTTDVPGA